MKRGFFNVFTIIIPVLIIGTKMANGQGTVPAGIHYQAVARDSKGELARKNIEVRFIIHAGSEYGDIVHQELHVGVVTSDYGVFSLIIGQGTREPGGTAASFSDIDWSTANHYLQVQVKFSSDFIDMGSPIRFMAVPYAMYAGKSLEPGPPGPPGPQGIPGDPATDDQTLIYNRSTKELSISNGNTVTLDTEVAFRARNLISDLAPKVTYITMTYDAPDLNISDAFNPSTGIFTAPTSGIYTFNIGYFAEGPGDAREIAIHLNSALYETIATSVASGNTVGGRSITMRLSAGNTVNVVIFTGTAEQTGTGSFAGYKVN